jgi:phosphoglycolate phosphatase-like HAD superfamily hydrolase
MRIQNKDTNRHKGIVLFDIDGTLILGGVVAHRAAFYEAVERLTGRVCLRRTPWTYDGMTDIQILRLMLLRACGSKRQASRLLPRAIKLTEKIFMSKAGRLEMPVAKGARALLHRLTQAGYMLGVISGNLRRIGELKLRKSGITTLFDLKIFGDHYPNRLAMTRDAVRLCETRFGLPRSRIILIGDTPRDVMSAKKAGLKILAVATGAFNSSELRKSKPYKVLSNLGDVHKCISTIESAIARLHKPY